MVARLATTRSKATHTRSEDEVGPIQLWSHLLLLHTSRYTCFAIIVAGFSCMRHVLHGSIQVVLHYYYSLLVPSHLHWRFFLSGFWIPVEVLVLKDTVFFCRSFWPPSWFDGLFICPLTFIDARTALFSLLVVLLPVLALVRKWASFWKMDQTAKTRLCLRSHHISSKWRQFDSLEGPNLLHAHACRVSLNETTPSEKCGMGWYFLPSLEKNSPTTKMDDDVIMNTPCGQRVDRYHYTGG
jgi:hypothetical protein